MANSNDSVVNFATNVLKDLRACLLLFVLLVRYVVVMRLDYNVVPSHLHRK